MKQVLQNLRNGETLVVDVPIPTPQAGEILVQTAASLVSAGTERALAAFAEKSLVGKARSRPDLARQVVEKARRDGLLTTLEAAFNRLDQPMPVGYSSAGRVAALGEGVSGIAVGERLACAGGGYAVHAEYGVVPRNLVVHLPDSVDFEAGAFTTLGAIALHGFRLAEAQIGERVAVIGLGLIGLLALQIAQAAGCRVLGIDLDLRRVALGNSFGAECIPRQAAPEAAQAFTHGCGCDTVLICADTTSSDAVELAGLIARDRARVVATGAVGLNLPRKIYYEKELTFLNSRSYGPGRYDPVYEEGGQDYPIGYVRWTEGRNLEAFVDLLSSRKVDVHPLISHRFPVEQAPQAYELVTGKKEEPFLGVLLTYPQEPFQAEGRTVTVASQIAQVNQGAAGSTTSSAATSESPAGGVIWLGMLGAGSFATGVLLPAIGGRGHSAQKAGGIELVGIASASGMNAQHAARRFGAAYATSDEERILGDPQINTVAVLTRHALHARQTVAALQAGKNVFCEKPLAITLDEVEQIQQALLGLDHEKHEIHENQKNKAPLLMVGFNRRFSPMGQKLQTFLAGRSEPLAAHYRVNAGYLPLSHWLHDPAQGGGRIIGEGCHFIDFLSFLVGAPPISVRAQGLPDHGRYREDNVLITLAFADGSLGSVTYLANGDKAFSKERVEVFCAARSAALDDFRSLELVENGQRREVHSRLRQDKGHRGEWEAFRQAITGNRQPPIPYDQILGVARAAILAVEALRTQETINV